ncbi:MAG: DUF4397 domain-containing protein [Chitinophagaceae bacterium]|nr:DUF4397 domain-containing protein [Chitinophagaceae bacterium]
MKRTKILMTGLGVVAMAALYQSCTKTNFKRVANTNDDFNNKAQVQVYNATVNTTRNYVYADGVPLTGAPMVYTQTTATNAAHTGSGLIFLLNPGVHAFSIRDTLITSTQPPLNFAVNLDANKFYTIFTYDSTNAVKQKMVETEIVIPSDSTARVRFANFVYWRTGTPPAMDIFSKRRNENIFSGVTYTQVTDFIPYASTTSDSLIVRQAGTMIALDTAVFTFTPKRSYTLVFRGRYATDETGGALFPRTLAVFTNK